MVVGYKGINQPANTPLPIEPLVEQGTRQDTMTNDIVIVLLLKLTEQSGKQARIFFVAMAAGNSENMSQKREGEKIVN